jgi:hypothetical protein
MEEFGDEERIIVHNTPANHEKVRVTLEGKARKLSQAGKPEKIPDILEILKPWNFCGRLSMAI